MIKHRAIAIFVGLLFSGQLCFGGGASERPGGEAHFLAFNAIVSAQIIHSAFEQAGMEWLALPWASPEVSIEDAFEYAGSRGGLGNI